MSLPSPVVSAKTPHFLSFNDDLLKKQRNSYQEKAVRCEFGLTRGVCANLRKQFKWHWLTQASFILLQTNKGAPKTSEWLVRFRVAGRRGLSVMTRIHHQNNHSAVTDNRPIAETSMLVPTKIQNQPK
jgi:hypothetical protein